MGNKQLPYESLLYSLEEVLLSLWKLFGVDIKVTILRIYHIFFL